MESRYDVGSGGLLAGCGYSGISGDAMALDSGIGLQLAIAQIRFAREYTLSLLDTIPEERWFEQPVGAASHVAWQVGHLAMAQYGLCLLDRKSTRLNSSHGALSRMPSFA